MAASQHAESTAYVTIDGHRSDNFHPYVFKTTDLGKTWTNISGNLSDGGPVYVIAEVLARLLKTAENDVQRREIEQRIQGLQAMAGGEPGEAPAGGFGARRAQGLQAGPGYYLVRLTVNGKVCSTTLRVRMDPLFEEMSK